MLEQILAHLNNWFLVSDGIHEDTYTVEGGRIMLPFLKNGQYFRICGSVFNDGLYRYFDGAALCENGIETMLTGETFRGTIWALAVPKAVIDLAEEIVGWQEKYGARAASPYASESFGGYSYTKPGNTADGAGGNGWETAFRSKLNLWRKI